MDSSILIVGLGNPGSEYEKTRHNVGFHVIDHLAKKLECNLVIQKSCKSLVAKHKFSATQSCILAKPLTFMNLSGQAVVALLKWYSLTTNTCIIVTDNVDLSVGSVRVKQKGSGGTHNGIRSVQNHLQSFPNGLDYIRVYVGVGRQRTNQNLARYVLGKWHSSEDEIYQLMFEKISEAIIKSIVNFKMFSQNIQFSEYFSRIVSEKNDV